MEGGDHGLAVRGVAAKQARGAGAKKGGADSKTAGEGGGAGPLDVALEAVVRWIKVGGQAACTCGVARHVLGWCSLLLQGSAPVPALGTVGKRLVNGRR